jgi:hypothetical protein
MVVRAQENNRVVGLVSILIPKGIAIIQYADDTIMCLGADENQARYMKLLLYIYEQLSGLKINFEKSKILSIGGDNDMDNSFAEIFNCQVGLFPVKYLGVSISAKRMRVIDWMKLEEKLGKKLDTWQGNSLSYGGRTLLINSSL